MARVEGWHVITWPNHHHHHHQAFLDKRVAKQVTKVSLLSQVPAQYGLLLLRYCIQADLRHLMRSLDTEGLMIPWWLELDKLLVDRVVAFRGLERCPETDFRLITLPVKSGGMGVYSHAECAEHARAAMIEMADFQLISTFQTNIPSSRTTVAFVGTKQSERLKPVFEERRAKLLLSLPNLLQEAILESASPIARAWLSVLPFSPQLRLRRQEVQAGIMARTLCQADGATCKCGSFNVPSHDEVCSLRQRERTTRHLLFQKCIASQLQRVTGTSVVLEPEAPGSQDRTDFRVTGPASYGDPRSEYDLTFHSLAQSATRERAHANVEIAPGVLDPEAVDSVILRRISAQLAFHEADKNAKYLGRTETSFHPVVISAGGRCSTSTQDIFMHWRSVVPNYTRMIRELSIILMRNRSRSLCF